MGFNVTGIEISERRLKLCHENCKKYKIKAKLDHGDIRNLYYNKDSFDYVFCRGIIEHFPESEQAVKELARVIKSGGIAMISVPHKITIYNIFKVIQKVSDKLFRTNFWLAGYEKSFTISHFKSMLEINGFRIKRFRKDELYVGNRFPLISRTIRLLDKPLLAMGFGGHFLVAFVEKT